MNLCSDIAFRMRKVRCLLPAVALFAALFPFGSFTVADDVFDKLPPLSATPVLIKGSGFVTDASHPNHPGDFYKYEITTEISLNPQLGEATIKIGYFQNQEQNYDYYYFRRGRIFQVDDSTNEVFANPFGDLAVASVGTIHPLLATIALQERRQFLRSVTNGEYLFSWNDELWDVKINQQNGSLSSLERNTYHDVFGNGAEMTQYDNWSSNSSAPGKVTIYSYGREILQVSYTTVEPTILAGFPEGDRYKDKSRVISSSEIQIKEISSHLSAIDLESMNTRIFIAEFAEFLVVFEGAYNSRNCDLIAEAVRSKFNKPVRYFGFSHLHGQYIGGTRSWVNEGATVLVPPTTAPLVEEIVKASHSYRPDALNKNPKPAKIEIVADKKSIKDGANEVVFYNIVSQHTDEYMVCYFPAQKVLLTGDLLFYREGKQLTGRSKKLCETIEKLGIDVETCFVTWPLSGYGTKSIVTKADMAVGCAK